jgi:hypothetical protein
VHHAAGELVDDEDLVVLDDVGVVAAEQLVRPERLVRVVDERDVLDVVEVGALSRPISSSSAWTRSWPCSVSVTARCFSSFSQSPGSSRRIRASTVR